LEATVKQLMALVRTALLLIAVAALTLFVVQNLAPVEVTFMTWSVSPPRALSVVASLVLGAALGSALTLAASRRT
jgi:uncharacterized integral membrane protein